MTLEQFALVILILVYLEWRFHYMATQAQFDALAEKLKNYNSLVVGTLTAQKEAITNLKAEITEMIAGVGLSAESENAILSQFDTIISNAEQAVAAFNEPVPVKPSAPVQGETA
jgi:hypothetical protein